MVNLTEIKLLMAKEKANQLVNFHHFIQHIFKIIPETARAKSRQAFFTSKTAVIKNFITSLFFQNEHTTEIHNLENFCVIGTAVLPTEVIKSEWTNSLDFNLFWLRMPHDFSHDMVTAGLTACLVEVFSWSAHSDSVHLEALILPPEVNTDLRIREIAIPCPSLWSHPPLMSSVISTYQPSAH